MPRAEASDKCRRRYRVICVHGRLGATVEYLQGDPAVRGKETDIFAKDMSIMEVLQATPRTRAVFVVLGIEVKAILAELNTVKAQQDGVDQ